MRKLLLIAYAILILPIPASAQNWTGVLANSRAPYYSGTPSTSGWMGAGAGTIPARSTVCMAVSLTAGSGAAAANGAAIRSALASCGGSNQAVTIASGTWYVDYVWYGTSLSGMVSNVTLRGAGANSTFLILSGGTCNGVGTTGVCMLNANNNYNGGVSNLASWTSGYSVGTTSITINSFSQGSVGNLHVGSLLILNQLDDASDPGTIYVCASTGSNGTCSQQGFSGNYGQTQGAESQQVTVTSISGSGPWTVGITPGTYAPNWTSGKSPIVWFSSALPISGDGLESMSLDYSALPSGSAAGIMICNGSSNWVKDVRGVNSNGNVHKHVWLYQAVHNTIRDSYFYGSNGSSESYGVDAGFYSADNQTENIICQHISTCTITEDSIGNVFAYNFAVDDFYWGAPAGNAANFQQEDQYHHLAGDAFNLYEGNEGIGHTDDDIHGTAFMNTTFRTVLTGHDAALTSDNGTGQCSGIPPTNTSPCEKTEYTIAYDDFAGSRYMNVIGSVLGTSGYHTQYNNAATSSSDGGNGMGNVSIYCLGFSGNACTYWTTGFNIPTDPLVSSTMMRWGNYDVVNAAVRFVSGEVPSGLSMYANPVPSSHTLPNSFYLPSAGASKPAFWTTPPWPNIGPDVSGGDIPNVGGYAYSNPASVCYHNQMGGVDNGSSGLLPFDAYASTGSGGCAYGTSSPGGPVVSLSATSLAFGPIAPLGTATQTVTLTNTGSGNLTMTSTTISGSGLYTIMSNSCTGTIGAGSNCSTTVLFSPTTFGLTSATLTFVNNASPTTQSVTLNGNAVVSPPGPPPAPILN